MRQLILRCLQDATGSVNHLPVLPVGHTALANADGDQSKVPMPTAGVFDHLVARRRTNGTDAAGSLTVRRNGSATDLSASFAVDVLTAEDLAEHAHFDQGDDLDYLWNTSAGSTDAQASIEFVPDDEEVSIFGLSPGAGAKTAGDGWFGGALGNGVFEDWTDASTYSATYSLVPTPGDLTRLFLKNYRGDLGTSVVTGYILLNGVRQDGTNDTINTAVELTGTTLTNFRDFVLPLVKGDRVEILVLVTVADLADDDANIGASVCFAATNDGEFPICGGDANTLSTADANWLGIGSRESASEESYVTMPISVGRLTTAGLVAEVDTAPGTGKSWTATARKNNADTSTTLLIDDDALHSIDDTVAWDYDDLLNLELTPSGTPAAAHLYWGLIGRSADTPPTIPASTKRWKVHRLDVKTRAEYSA